MLQGPTRLSLVGMANGSKSFSIHAQGKELLLCGPDRACEPVLLQHRNCSGRIQPSFWLFWLDSSQSGNSIPIAARNCSGVPARATKMSKPFLRVLLGPGERSPILQAWKRRLALKPRLPASLDRRHSPAKMGVA